MRALFVTLTFTFALSAFACGGSDTECVTDSDCQYVCDPSSCSVPLIMACVDDNPGAHCYCGCYP